MKSAMRQLAKQEERTCRLLRMHYQQYPCLQIQDVLKFLYQSSFGCEHLVSSLESAIERIGEESRSCPHESSVLIDMLDGEYSRVHLSYLARGLRVETLGRLFFASSHKEIQGGLALEKKLNLAKKLVCERVLPFSPDEFEEAVREWKARSYPAVHHSDSFRLNYRPAYRVIANRYVAFLPLFAQIDRMLCKDRVVIAIEGGSASGKTTLSEMLEECYDCTVFHMDDFFLRPEQRTEERYAEAGGNIDRERFLEEVLIPLRNNQPVHYRKFDCASLTLSPAVAVMPKKITIIEGVYSMHPAFAGYYDWSVFLDIAPEMQRARIAKRNSPQMADRFYGEWIPLETAYFSTMQVKERCNLSILASDA